MIALSRIPPAKISAVVSDVDGTLMTDEKRLTARAQAAVAELHARGIIFTIISSRPLRGLRMLIEPLQITAPIGCFNGGLIVKSDLSVIIEHVLPPHITRRAVDMLGARGVQAWIFAGPYWLALDADGPYVGLEERTVGFGPTIVAEFGPAPDAAAKIVGVSADFELLTRCERDIGAALAGQASVVCSQPYYLDITHPLANKGGALSELAKLLAIPLAMFERSGLSIAMGNAGPEVQSAADFVTNSNGEEGFANAVERFILRGDRPTREMARAGGHAW